MPVARASCVSTNSTHGDATCDAEDDEGERIEAWQSHRGLVELGTMSNVVSVTHLEHVVCRHSAVHWDTYIGYHRSHLVAQLFCLGISSLGLCFFRLRHKQLWLEVCGKTVGRVR